MAVEAAVSHDQAYRSAAATSTPSKRASQVGAAPAATPGNVVWRADLYQ
jgi:hypothetical protein